MSAVRFREATENDVGLILQFIRALAEYEKMADEVVADEATLSQQLFEKKHAEVIFAVKDEKEVGFALYFHNFSTFLGRAGLYLEDLYVLPEYRSSRYANSKGYFLLNLLLQSLHYLHRLMKGTSPFLSTHRIHILL